MGLYLVGICEGVEHGKPYTSKDGTRVEPRTYAFSIGGLQNVLVETNEDLDFEKGQKYEVPVKASARTWDEASKRFQYVNVKFYIPKGAIS